MFSFFGRSNFAPYTPEDPEPTLILICPSCHAEILFYGDGDEQVDEIGFYILGEYDHVVCDCGATYGEGDELESLDERAY